MIKNHIYRKFLLITIYLLLKDTAKLDIILKKNKKDKNGIGYENWRKPR